MALERFGVTPTQVRNHHLPGVANFSASSNPSAATVQEMIDAEAAELAGKLKVEGLSASAISAVDNPAAYAWCADTIRLGAAVRAMRAMVGQNPAVVQALVVEVNARYDELDREGLGLLADVTVPLDEANAVRSHLAGDTVTAPFSRDDEL
jgi:hypothetical protein